MTRESDEIIIYTANEPTPFLEEANKQKILKLLDDGYTTQDIAALLKLDLMKVQTLVTTYNKEKWKYMTRGEVLNEHLASLNEMIDVAKSQYMQLPLPPAAQAAALLIQTALSVSDTLDNKEDPQERKQAVLEGIIQPLIEETMVRMTREMARIKNQVLESTPLDKQQYMTEQINGVITTLGDTMSDTYKVAEKSLDGIFKSKKRNGHAPTTMMFSKPLMVQK